MIDSGWTKIEVINENDINTFIYILKNNNGSIAILNSGSDSKKIIDKFSLFLKKHPDINKIYTAIRPEKKNPFLYKWTINAISPTDDDKTETIKIRRGRLVKD